MEQPASKPGPREYAVQAVVGPTRAPKLVPLRLIIMPLPADKTATNCKKLKRKASKHQDELDPRSLIAAGFMVLVTSLPADIPAEEICAAYRLRWQIELAFKRLKSLLHIDKLRTKTEAGTRCWLYAHLIVALLGDDLSQDFVESFPSGAI